MALIRGIKEESKQGQGRSEGQGGCEGARGVLGIGVGEGSKQRQGMGLEHDMAESGINLDLDVTLGGRACKSAWARLVPDRGVRGVS